MYYQYYLYGKACLLFPIHNSKHCTHTVVPACSSASNTTLQCFFLTKPYGYYAYQTHNQCIIDTYSNTCNTSI